MNKKILKNILNDIYRVLINHQQTPILISGTLLGIIRDNNFIDGDLDIDLGIVTDKVEGFDLTHWFNIFKNLEQLGFSIRRADTKSLITIDRGFGCDIWWINKNFCYPEEKSYYSIRAWNGEFRYSSENFDTLDEIKWDNKTYKIPHNHELFLEQTFGCDWKVPNANFKQPHDSPCFVVL